MIGKLIRFELYKAFYNKWFVISLGIGCTLAVLSAAGCYIGYLQDQPLILEYRSSNYYPISVLSVFGYWIGINTSQPTTDLFFLLVPLLSALPFSWSLSSERRSGYSCQVILRVGSLNYYGAKLIVAFISGALVLLLPLALNFCACMCFAPFYTPEIDGATVFGIYEDSFWSFFFYNVPGIYLFFRASMIVVFGGLWSAFLLALSFVIRRQIPLLVVPYIALLFLKYVNELILIPFVGFQEDLTPFGYLRSFPVSGYSTSWWTILIEFIGMGLFAIALVTLRRKDDML